MIGPSSEPATLKLSEILGAMSYALDMTEGLPAGHSARGAWIALRVADELGILDKPGKLDATEWDAMRRHPVASEVILSRISVFADAARIGGAHHERLDGKGYPKGLADTAIDLETRIVTVADVFDALTADRPYRKAMPIAQALSIIDADLGSAFDGPCVYALKRALAVTAAAAPLAA